MKRLRRLTGILTILTAGTAIALVLSIYFGFDGSGRMYTAESVSRRLHILAWPAGALLLSAAASALAELRMPRKRESAGVSADGFFLPNENPKAVRFCRILLAVSAAVLILAGILNGSMRDVLVKAVNICTECIGLG